MASATMTVDVQGVQEVRDLVAAYRRVLEECRHELTTRHGLYAIDHDPRANPAMVAHTWQLDCAALLERIDAVLPSAQTT